MPTPQTSGETSVRTAAYHTVTKRLGNWTTARRFEVRAARGVAVLDLRSPHIPAGEIRVDVDLDRSTLKLLVADDATIDDWDLRRTGRGRVKDREGPGHGRRGTPAPTASARAGTDDTRPAARRIVLTGQLRHAEVRVHRGGTAVLSAMFSRDYWVDLRRAHRQGTFPTVDDPTRTA